MTTGARARAHLRRAHRVTTPATNRTGPHTTHSDPHNVPPARARCTAPPRRCTISFSESDIDHVVEVAADFYSLDEMLAIMEEESAS